MTTAARQPRRSWLILLRPRWLAFHAIGIAGIAGMLWLGLWQLQRAESGNELSWAYTFEWPLFTIFAVYFWVKSVREELSIPQGAERSDDVSSGDASGSQVGPASSGQSSSLGPAGVGDRDGLDGPATGESADAYLELLMAEARRHRKRGHARWHGWR